jgi:hypothetical protein
MGDKEEVLEAVLKETVDLENVPIEEVFESLRCSREGLTTEAADERLALFGHNKLEEKKVLFLSLCCIHVFFWNFGFWSIAPNDYNFYVLKQSSFFFFFVAGKQIPEISWFHVEPSFLGYGSCCYHGYCSC